MKTIVMADLPPAQQKAFFEFLASSQVEFEGEVDGSYVATVRVFAEDKFTKQDYLYTGGQIMARETKAVWVPSDEEAKTIARLKDKFPNLTSCLKPPKEPLKAIRLAQMERLIEEFYDLQFQRDFQNAEAERLKGVEFQFGKSFGELVHQFMAKKYGVTRVMNQLIWNVLYAVDKHEQDNVMMHSFDSFLCHAYAPADLLFYCFARSLLKRDARNQSAPLTLQQCEKKMEIFEREFKLGKELIDLIKTMLDNKLKVDMWTFLALAVQTYHDSRCQKLSRETAEASIILQVPELISLPRSRSMGPESPALGEGATFISPLGKTASGVQLGKSLATLPSPRKSSRSSSSPANSLPREGWPPRQLHTELEQNGSFQDQLSSLGQSPRIELRTSSEIPAAAAAASPNVHDNMSTVSSKHSPRSARSLCSSRSLPYLRSTSAVNVLHRAESARRGAFTKAALTADVSRAPKAEKAQPAATTFPYQAPQGDWTPYSFSRMRFMPSKMELLGSSSSPLQESDTLLARNVTVTKKRMGEGAQGLSMWKKDRKKLARGVTLQMKHMGEGTEGLEIQEKDVEEEAQGLAMQKKTTARTLTSQKTETGRPRPPEKLHGRGMLLTQRTESGTYATHDKVHQGVSHRYPRRLRSPHHVAQSKTPLSTPERSPQRQEFLERNAQKPPKKWHAQKPKTHLPESHTVFSDGTLSASSPRSSPALSPTSLAGAFVEMNASNASGNASVQSFSPSSMASSGVKSQRSRPFMAKVGFSAKQKPRERFDTFDADTDSPARRLRVQKLTQAAGSGGTSSTGSPAPATYKTMASKTASAGHRIAEGAPTAWPSDHTSVKVPWGNTQLPPHSSSAPPTASRSLLPIVSGAESIPSHSVKSTPRRENPWKPPGASRPRPLPKALSASGLTKSALPHSFNSTASRASVSTPPPAASSQRNAPPIRPPSGHPNKSPMPPSGSAYPKDTAVRGVGKSTPLKKARQDPKFARVLSLNKAKAHRSESPRVPDSGDVRDVHASMDDAAPEPHAVSQLHATVPRKHPRAPIQSSPLSAPPKKFPAAAQSRTKVLPSGPGDTRPHRYKAPKSPSPSPNTYPPSLSPPRGKHSHRTLENPHNLGAPKWRLPHSPAQRKRSPTELGDSTETRHMPPPSSVSPSAEPRLTPKAPQKDERRSKSSDFSGPRGRGADAPFSRGTGSITGTNKVKRIPWNSVQSPSPRHSESLTPRGARFLRHPTGRTLTSSTATWSTCSLGADPGHYIRLLSDGHQ
eukprot:GEMP01003151.1.p1 GENE.GEMP01003151.1~~GEMP01003151.1.p1  ORF type:complete len:1259 (+),score=275.10 GEMP01003151.1:178-3954(+)